MSVDQALAELQQIAIRLDELDADDPERARLEERRAELRTAARAAGDLARNPTALRRELTSLENQLKQIEGQKIKRSLMEHGKWLNDASAYANAINQRIEEGTTIDREAVEARIAELRSRLDELDRS